MNMSLLDAAYADSRDSIQLEAAYKAFQDDTGKGGTGPSLQEKQNKATRDQIRRRLNGSERTEKIFVTKTIFQLLETKSAGKREGRYRPTRSKTFIDRLPTAKREKEELKIKSVDFSTAHQRAYIVVNVP